MPHQPCAYKCSQAISDTLTVSTAAVNGFGGTVDIKTPIKATPIFGSNQMEARQR
jgi:hypothetical protein